MNQAQFSNKTDKIKKEAFSWRNRALSFKYAWKGIVYTFKTQHNMWIHSVAAIITIMLAWLLQLPASRWLLIMLCIGLVMALEIVNTAIETLVDQLHPQRHPKIGLVKDLAAGAVLVAAVTAFIVGCCIFGPALVIWLKY